MLLAGKLLFYLMDMDISHPPVMFRGEVFGEVISKVFFPFIPIEAEFFFLIRHYIQFKGMLKALERLYRIFTVIIPCEVALSILMGVRGCGCTIYVNVVLI